jgi:hypothetical protein
MGKRRGNREGTIYQRSDGRWTGQLTVGIDPATRKPIRKTVYGSTRGEVVAALTELRGKLAEDAAGSQMKLRDALDLWLAGVKSRLEPSSYGRYQLATGTIREYLGG